MLNKPLVSIVICCYNRRDYLKKTMESVFAQHYQPVEIIVMDDGSTDNTDDLIASYGCDVRYFRQERQGISAARTAASQLATGEYIAYQDDDDLMPPDRITHLYAALQKYPSAVFATGDYALIDAQGELTGERWLPGKLEKKDPATLIDDGYAAILWPHVPAVPHTTLIRKADGERIGWFDPEFKYACSDADFLARLGQLGPVVYLPEVVSYYRRGHTAIWNDDLRANISRLQLWGKHMSLLGTEQAELRRQLQKRMLKALKKISRERGQRTDFDEKVVAEYIDKARTQLGLKERFLYGWYCNVKLPLKNRVLK